MSIYNCNLLANPPKHLPYLLLNAKAESYLGTFK